MSTLLEKNIDLVTDPKAFDIDLLPPENWGREGRMGGGYPNDKPSCYQLQCVQVPSALQRQCTLGNNIKMMSLKKHSDI